MNFYNSLPCCRRVMRPVLRCDPSDRRRHRWRHTTHTSASAPARRHGLHRACGMSAPACPSPFCWPTLVWQLPTKTGRSSNRSHQPAVAPIQIQFFFSTVWGTAKFSLKETWCGLIHTDPWGRKVGGVVVSNRLSHTRTALRFFSLFQFFF